MHLTPHFLATAPLTPASLTLTLTHSLGNSLARSLTYTRTHPSTHPRDLKEAREKAKAVKKLQEFRLMQKEAKKASVAAADELNRQVCVVVVAVCVCGGSGVCVCVCGGWRLCGGGGGSVWWLR